VGSSSAQSLARGAGSIETDYLNGEIIMLGRRHGVPTPINAYFAGVTQTMVSNGQAAGTLTIEAVRLALPQLFEN
jgi:2-dehydropantoate 2-reductase